MKFSGKMWMKIQIDITLLLWFYIIYRAFFISIIQDEAHTAFLLIAWVIIITNYYSKSYPDKYIFNYQVIFEKAQMDSLNTSLLSKFDYLLLTPPYNDSALLKNWSIKLSFPESGAKVLKNDSVNILREEKYLNNRTDTLNLVFLK